MSVARAHERAATHRTGDGATAEASQSAYDELALSFEELTVAQEELRTRNDEVTEATMRIELERLVAEPSAKRTAKTRRA